MMNVGVSEPPFSRMQPLATERCQRLSIRSAPAEPESGKVNVRFWRKTDIAAGAARFCLGLLVADTYALRKVIAAVSNQRGFLTVTDSSSGLTQMGGLATVGVCVVPHMGAALQRMIALLGSSKHQIWIESVRKEWAFG